jgi:hypothetical protein
MTILDRGSRSPARLATLALAGALIALAMPAEARLHDPGIGGPISGGSFQGLPVRAQAPAARTSERGLRGVVGENCYVVRQVVRDRLGATQLRTVRVCE